MRVLLVAVIGLAAATTSAQAGSSACNASAAKQAIRQANLKMEPLGPVTASSVSKVICHDFTRDGRTDMAVTIASGGTAGDIGYVVFRALPGGKWAVALKNGGGYKVGIFQVGGDLVSSHPIYRPNDPNCCPTGGFAHDRYHWRGGRFVLVRSYHTKTYKP